MKKFLAMALAAVMVLALAACGSKNDTADDTGDAQDAQGGETQKQQLVNQLYKLPDVCSIKEFTPDTSVSCELMLIKLKNDSKTRSDILAAADAFGAKTMDYSKDSLMLCLTSESRKIDEFVDLMRDYEILEICRTGNVSLEKGSTTIRQAINF